MADGADDELRSLAGHLVGPAEIGELLDIEAAREEHRNRIRR